MGAGGADTSILHVWVAVGELLKCWGAEREKGLVVGGQWDIISLIEM